MFVTLQNAVFYTTFTKSNRNTSYKSCHSDNFQLSVWTGLALVKDLQGGTDRQT